MHLIFTSACHNNISECDLIKYREWHRRQLSFKYEKERVNRSTKTNKERKSKLSRIAVQSVKSTIEVYYLFSSFLGNQRMRRAIGLSSLHPHHSSDVEDQRRKTVS